jgi:hypothetical protein
MSMSWRWLLPALVSSFSWLAAQPAGAVPFTQSVASAESSESGEDEGIERDGDIDTNPDGTAEAVTFRCPGTALCSFLPGDPGVGGRGFARTDYGSNRASSFAEEGYGVDDVSVANYAGASSFWSDEWTFDVAPSSAGQAVTLDIHLDGFWENGAFAEYALGIGTRIVPPPEPDPEGPPPFLDPDLDLVAGVSFLSTSPNLFAGPPLQIIVLPDGDHSQGDGDEDPNGSVDIVVTISFVPEPGATYVVQARLDVRSVGRYTGGHSHAGFDSTAEIVRVVVPEGTSFTSAAGADWNVQVPEPAVALLVMLGLGVLVSRRRS